MSNGFRRFQTSLNSFIETLSEVETALSSNGRPDLAVRVERLRNEASELGQGEEDVEPSSGFRRLSSLFNQFSQELDTIQTGLRDISPELAVRLKQLRNEVNKLGGGG